MKTLTAIALTLTFLAPLGLIGCAEPADAPVEADMPEAGNEMTDDGDIDTAPVTDPNGEMEATEEALGIEDGTPGNIGVLPEDGDVENIDEGDVDPRD